MTIQEQFNDTLDYIRRYYKDEPDVGIVLGTGMGALAECIEIERALAYNFIPHFPISTVESHFGKLLFGKLGNKKVIAMQGRLHYYEGYTMNQITYPIRILKLLGIKTLFLSNAAGGLNPQYHKGDIVVVDDHINLLPEHPLRGPNLTHFGPRFPDMFAPYDRELQNRAAEIARQEKIAFHERGVYVAVQGPCLETRAEYRFLRQIGADMVGMSTVPEVIVANHAGIRCFAASIITDECAPDKLKPVRLEEIIRVAEDAQPRLSTIFRRLITES
jgi:purine-nucleoside phosphorylase